MLNSFYNLCFFFTAGIEKKIYFPFGFKWCFIHNHLSFDKLGITSYIHRVEKPDIIEIPAFQIISFQQSPDFIREYLFFSFHQYDTIRTGYSKLADCDEVADKWQHGENNFFCLRGKACL